jgi:Tol biopolymer transport system component
MVQVAGPRHVAFVREGTLLAQQFDPVTWQLSGATTVLAPDVRFSAGNGRVGATASRTGTFAYAAGLGAGGSGDAQLAWLDRSGRELGRLGSPANLRGVELSPDGRFVATHADEGTATGDIWITDVERGTTTGVTVDPEHHNVAPVWTRDGRALVFTKQQDFAGPAVYEHTVGASTAPRLVTRARAVGNNPYAPTDLSAFGDLVLSGSGPTGPDIFRVPLAGGTPVPVVSGRAQEFAGQLSPDGRWLAFTSDEGGSPGVFVQRFPEGGSKLQVASSVSRWHVGGRTDVSSTS